ncbi:3-hydroxyacyl-CoA dehydrogenase [Desulfoluna sp.]|uniref:3-hydroxyacyl-CoA dehydrogenase n=1 Tax=Desulfoluna sp. TaxID=2045199 RepID=UPI0026049C79|nr:3-hydroxyacyl-CoA dehydrogenase [Desulfoluna sp.]
MAKTQKVLIVGAGTMGQQIGYQCAACGLDVTLYDTSEEALEKALITMKKFGKLMVAGARVTQEADDGVMARVRTTTDLTEAGKDADIVSESVPEDPKLKAKVFSALNEICPAHTLFTTNTSTLLPSMIAEATGRPDRFAALHFHVVLTTNIVDIMPHPGTSKETLEAIREFVFQIDQYPIELKKEQNGYVFNTMLSQLFDSALTLASREVASVEDIDRAWMGIMKTMMGPFGIMDSIGLETIWKITDYWAQTSEKSQPQRNADFVKRYVDEGNLGIKTKKGFYSYPNPAFFSPEFMKGIK